MKRSEPKRPVGFLRFAVLLSIACFTPFLLQAWRDVRTFYFYKDGRCTIVNRGSYQTELSRRNDDTRPAGKVTHPELMYRVDAAGAHYFTFGFDNMGGRMSDLSDADPFEIGHSYPCWFDPWNPERAVLRRKLYTKFYAGAAIPMFMLLVTASMLRGASPKAKTKTLANSEGTHGQVLARRLRPDFTSAGRVKTGYIVLAVYTPIAIAGSVLLFVHGQWFFAALLIASEVGLVRRFLRFRAARDAADPIVEVDDAKTRGFVWITPRGVIQKLNIALLCDGESTTLVEKENVGEVREHVTFSVPDDAQQAAIVVTQDGIETAFDLH